MIPKERWGFLIIAVFIIIQYANTLTLGYALDDRLVIYNNEYTLKGFDGVKDLFTNDGFSGFFTEQKSLVAGGRYRPLAQFTFIIEYELFGKDLKEKITSSQAAENEQLFLDAHLALIGHLVNILLYLLLTWIVYLILKKIFPTQNKEKWYFSISFLATLIFALHPLHTEAVANIKGRDEIMAMLGAMLTVLFVLQYVDKHKLGTLLLAFFSMLFGIFSKENAITFLAVIPLALYFYRKPKKSSDWLVTLIPSFAAVIIFLIFRTNALGSFMPEDTSNTILNNPYLNSSTAQRIATTIFTWGIYLKLLLFPHPLTHDYYPYQIKIIDFSNPIVILLLLFSIFILYYAIKNLRKKSIVSFGILFFLITFSIVSNLLFSTGTFMNERFIFISLLGFAIILAYYIHKLSELPKFKWLTITILTILFSFYLLKGVTRNRVWKDDFSLFTTDVKISVNSIKCNISAGGSYVQHYKKTNKKSDLTQALKYLNRAIKLDPYSYYANTLLGEAYFFSEEYHLAYQYFNNALLINPQNETAKNNVKAAETKLSASKISEADAKIKEGEFKEAMEIIDNYLVTETATASVYNIKGKIFGMGMNQLDSAIKYLHKALELDPEFVPSYENLGVAHAVKGEYGKALEYLLKAHELDPNNSSIIHNIVNVYRNSGNQSKVDEWSMKMD